ncbi:hypothetical protein MH117_20080 [Paenibacillus sp. ACRRX]|uniref:hypothetical protein n=1 Tax=unclassified Paenibacillus TaxID=185978 RepID=UPI001EF62672|nr:MULTISPECIES: hypothetical protein [unclassified Paenibacillus]MCG7409708.1 hypothetical protein [Paenibacillus sp. ACRRX]MDK8183215.1 hypothetical protein [Paenibacillus sp. UMB4589-SE434]
MIKDIIKELMNDISKREMFLQGKLNFAGVTPVQQQVIMESFSPKKNSPKDKVFLKWQ